MSEPRHRDPYIHDCKECIFVGWDIERSADGWKHPEDDVYVNIYFCPKGGVTAPPGQHLGSIIIRYGNEPHEYRSYPVFRRAKPHGITE